MPFPARFLRFRSVAAILAVLAVLVCCLAGCSGGDVRNNVKALRDKQRLIAALRYGLLTAVDLEKNALLSSVQSDGRMFLAKARNAMAGCAKDLARLGDLVRADANAKETEGFSAVAADFAQIEAVDATLLGLAGRNTNLQATALSRTEAALAISRLQRALTPIIDGPSCPAGREALRVVTAGLSILSLHTQHIAESSSAGMDTLEAAMNRQNARAAAALDRLSGLLPPDADAALLAEAKAAYADFRRVTQEVLGLSRQNTNIEAVALAMGQKRLVTAKALADLAALEDVVGEKEFTATR
ncbi:hypothetical protein DFW101_0686 [Solidesulfovibrio carbinoliphilus subsp. oakridgensis]|uniref:Uncharacterized protein n=1 Tax=Solidesulfovibrio carbinoliphilus subsp. oakridgensis TaxID=694327 RepID=G7Q3R3_9BACT|nr:hypothetical protein DFW101_0686 [Solidesulfovibrio carbinoliphilus subsp. oakridgensis]